MQTTSSEFTSAWEANSIRAVSKALIQFGDNRFNDSPAVFVNGQQVIAGPNIGGGSTAYGIPNGTKPVNRGIAGSFEMDPFPFFSPFDAFNNKNRNTMWWAVCDVGSKCDSGYRAASVDYTILDGPAYQRGWWSSAQSDVNGNFATPQNIYTTFTARNVNQILLWLDEAYPNMKEVECQYLNNAGTWVSLGVFTTTSGVYNYSWDISLQLVQGLKFICYSTENPNDYCRLIQLNGLMVADVSSDIVSYTLNNDKSEYKNTVPVGTTRANTLSLVLDNIDQKYSPENTNSPYYPYVTANSIISMYQGCDTNNNPDNPNYEYVPAGVFYADTWAANSSAMTTQVDCRDFSKFCQDNKVLTFGKVWLNTNVTDLMTDVMARLGKAPSEIHISQYDLTDFDALFLKDKIIWQFLGEVAFADQGNFGFNEVGDFYYDSYLVVYQAPYTTSVYSFDDSTNIVSATEETELFINSVTANVYKYDSADATVQKLWALTGDVTLSYATLSNEITPSMGGQPDIDPNMNPNDTITVTGSLDTPGLEWASSPDTPIYNQTGGYMYIDQEIIKYGIRTSTGFSQLTRGILDTPVQTHMPGAYIGECVVFDPLKFTNGPATNVQRVYSTCIDAMPRIVPDNPDPLARVLIWRPDAFGATLAIGNVTNDLTILSGTSTDTTAGVNASIPWITAVSGNVVIPKQNKTLQGGPPIGRATSTGLYSRFIKKYGLNETVIDSPWVESLARANFLINVYLDEYKDPRQLIVIDCICNPAIQSNDRITIVEHAAMSISNRDYNVINIDWTYDGALKASITAREVNPNPQYVTTLTAPTVQAGGQ